MNKPRFDSLLFQLSEEHQAQVYDWIDVLGYAKTKDRLAEPPPVGLSLSTHINSLRRFYRRYSQQVERDELAEASTSAPGSFQGSGRGCRTRRSLHRLSAFRCPARSEHLQPAQPLDQQTQIPQ